MKILVCGGREFGDLKSLKNNKRHPEWTKREKEYSFILEKLNTLAISSWPRHEPDNLGNWLPNVTIISGGANGADSVAIDWAITNWCQFREYKPDWRRYGHAAGPIRNQEMIDKEKPDLVIAFPGNRGTQDMIDKAKKHNIKVIEIEYEPK